MKKSSLEKNEKNLILYLVDYHFLTTNAIFWKLLHGVCIGNLIKTFNESQTAVTIGYVIVCYWSQKNFNNHRFCHNGIITIEGAAKQFA